MGKGAKQANPCQKDILKLRAVFDDLFNLSLKLSDSIDCVDMAINGIETRLKAFEETGKNRDE